MLTALRVFFSMAVAPYPCRLEYLYNSLFCWHIAAYLLRWLQFPQFLLYS